MMIDVGSNDIRTEEKRAALMEIAEANGGVLNPQQIVDYAADPASPLHDEFEWDDAKAGNLARLAQANGLVRRMRLTIIRQAAEPRKVEAMVTRQFQSRPSMRQKKGGYERVEDIFQDPIKRQEVLEQVLRELEAYRRRYRQLEELGAVWDALDEVISHGTGLSIAS